MVWVLLRLFGIVVLLAGGVLAVTRAKEPPYECVAFIELDGGPINRLCTYDYVPRVIGDEFGEYADLTLSPDEEWFAFVAPDPHSDFYKLMLMRSDGTGYQELTRMQEALMFPSWSPDGQWIAFYAQPDGLYLIHPDGSDLHALFAGDTELGWEVTQFSYFFNVAWSPDSEWIAVSSEKNLESGEELGPYNSDIYKVRMDGTGLRRLTMNPGVDTWPAWSPDGEWIAFVSEQGDIREIFVMRADGSKVRRLTFTPRYLQWDNYYLLSWSPDGKWLAFVRDDELPHRYRPLRVSLDSGQVEEITDRVSNRYSLIWSGDGKWILSAGYFRDSQGVAKLSDPVLYRARPDGRDFERLTFNFIFPPSGYVWLPTPARPWHSGIPLALGGLMVALSFFKSAFIRVHLRPILGRKTS